MIMIWEHWIIAISVGIVAIAFVVLVVYVILALLSMRQMVDDIDRKVQSFDPLFRVVSRAGKAIEKKASHVKELADDYDEPPLSERLTGERRSSKAVNTAMEVAEWAMIGMALWQKIRERR